MLFPKGFFRTRMHCIKYLPNNLPLRYASARNTHPGWNEAIAKLTYSQVCYTRIHGRSSYTIRRKPT